MFRIYVGSQLRLRAALEVAVDALVRVPLVMREPNVLGKLIYSICLEAADGTCNLALRVNVGLVSLRNITVRGRSHMTSVKCWDFLNPSLPCHCPIHTTYQ